MITLNNSNIDFGFEDESLGSKYSISLSRDTSNLVFSTEDIERMTIMKNGKVAIGKTETTYDLDVNGSINAGSYLINGQDISIITSDTSNYVRETSNMLIGRINDTSNYVRETSNMLIGRINDTCNYVRETSNMFIGRINDTSNYVLNTSNILIGRIIDTSNYMKDTSNILIKRINDTSNYIRDTSNILIVPINNTSNYAWNTNDILVSSISNTSNYVKITSNILIVPINDTSNYMMNTTDILVISISDTSNYVRTTSNMLISRIIGTSNYMMNTSDILVSSISDTSNYVKMTSNMLVSRIMGTSNYMMNTSNVLAGRINNTSNYVKITSNYMLNLVNSSIYNRWYLNNNMNNYNNYNVGIGTNNPVSKLHLYDEVYNTTSLTLQNIYSDYIISTLSTISPEIGTYGLFKYIIFKYDQSQTQNIQTSYTFTVGDKDLTADILVVAGGGGGGTATSTKDGGGGGGGGIVYMVNKTLSRNTTYYITVGKGGTPNNNGYASGITISQTAGDFLRFDNLDVVAIGGGWGGSMTNNNGLGGSGGSGGGGAASGDGTTDVLGGSGRSSTNSIWSTNMYKKQGYNGGNGIYRFINNTFYSFAGGGGGAGSTAYDIMTEENDPSNMRQGGLGIELKITSDTFTSFGDGGNASLWAGQNYNDYGNGTNNTGGGGNGGIVGYNNGLGGSGGSGIIIIRYTISSAILIDCSIHFKNFTTNYNIGNFNNDFKITSINSSQTNDRLVIKSSGFVGIGTTNPGYMLEVFDDRPFALASIREDVSGIYFKSSSISGLYTSSPYNPTPQPLRICAKFNDSILLTNGTYVISSDIRIKEDIQDINDDYALQKILAVELKKYKYIDKINKGDDNVYGFIAQQVKNVIPDAVNIEKSYIPNIMMVADYNNKIVILPYKPTKVIIKIKDKIKCYDSENKLIDVEVYEIINEVSFKIKDLDKEYTSNKIFVYGTYVDDFHTLFKDHIFALNVGATQELYRQLKKQKDIIKLQEDRMDILQRKNAILNDNFENLLKEIDLINKQLD